MRAARVLLIWLVACGIATAPSATAVPAVDDVTGAQIDSLITAGAGVTGTGDRIDLLSRQFLGTPYVANTLIGSPSQDEQLVVDLAGVDCFTYLDYVEALRRSASRDEFVANLIQTRYAGGRVDFLDRKHFFTDWAYVSRAAATDVTASLSAAAVPVAKQLNAKADGGVYVSGLPTVGRVVTYIPSAAVDGAVIAGLRTGDYVGAYADTPGLDVTHVGIFVATPDGPVFRNASSLPGNDRVVDSSFTEYVRSVPGIVVLRP